MANYSKVTARNIIDSILPPYGTPCRKVVLPVWDNSQKMFICDEYESASGNRYYRGIRFSNNLAIVEKVGLYHNWTYIDGIELYMFDGTSVRLMQCRKYDSVFRSEEFIRSESQAMVRDYLAAVLKMQHTVMSREQLEQEARAQVDRAYKSYLDSDYDRRLTQVLKCLEQKDE